MTIRNQELNRRLSNLESCAENAPEGAYEQAKAVAKIVGNAAKGLLSALRAAGLKAKNSDSLRDIEAAIYGYILDSNPEAYGLITGEGFGEHIEGPARDRVIAQASRDRDFLRAKLAEVA